MSDKRRGKEKAAFAFITALAMLTVLSLVSIVGYILMRALPALDLKLIFGDPDDIMAAAIWPMALNTLYLAGLTLSLALPLGVMAAIFLGEYAKQSPFTGLIRAATENLSGVPSIVFGLFGLVFFGKVLGLGWSMANGALTASIVVLPTIMRTTEEALKSVPRSFREGSLALGATKWQTIKGVVLRPAVPGIMSGVVLAVGRVVGETAALIFTLGSSDRAAASIMDSGRTLSMHLYMLAHEGLSPEGAYATALVLVGLVMLLNTITEALAGRALGKGGK